MYLIVMDIQIVINGEKELKDNLLQINIKFDVKDQMKKCLSCDLPLHANICNTCTKQNDFSLINQ